MTDQTTDTCSPTLTEVGREAFDGELQRLMRCEMFSIHPNPNAAPDGFFTLPDGRPAIMKSPILGVPQAITLYWNVWETKKSQFYARNQPVGSNERPCPNCGCKITPTNEFEDTWSFRCTACGCVDIWGKQYVGGTRGAGTKERI